MNNNPQPERPGEWRNMLPEEVIQEGDEVFAYTKYVPSKFIGSFPFPTMKYRTSRPLPTPAKEDENASPLAVQIGGSHYKYMAIQPAEYCHANGIEKLEGDAIAYLSRWRRKNGIEDLDKAIHSIQILKELELKRPRKPEQK